MNSLPVHSPPMAVEVSFPVGMLQVALADGRVVQVPLEWFTRLRDASPEQLSRWRFIGGGVGIHWEELDEDISVSGLLRG